MYVSPKTTYFGDVQLNANNGTAKPLNRVPTGINFTKAPTPMGNNIQSSNAWSKVLSNWTLRDDGTFRSGKNVFLPAGSNVMTPVVGTVSDSKNTDVFEAVLENPNYGSEFKRGQYLIGTRYGKNVGKTVDKGTRYIGASLNAICPQASLCQNDRVGAEKYFPFVQIALGSLNVTSSNQGAMHVTRKLPDIIAKQDPTLNSGIKRKTYSGQPFRSTDTGSFTFGGTKSNPVYRGAISPDTELMFASFNIPLFMRPLVAVRLGDDYSISDLFGFYTVNSLSVAKHPNTGDSSVVANQSFLKVGVDTSGSGEWAAYSSIQAKTTQFSGKFTLEKDKLPTGNAGDTYYELRQSTTGDTYRLYLSPSSKYFVMVPGSLKRDRVFLGFRMPTARVKTLAKNDIDTVASSTTVSGTVGNQTGEKTTVSMGPLGKSHPRNKNFSEYMSNSLSNNSSADTTFGSGVDITPDTSVSTDSFVTCLNVSKNPAANNANPDTFVPVIYESANGWIKVTTAGGTIVSRTGQGKVCFKPPHFSNMALAASTSTGDDGSSSSSDSGSGCLIERSGASKSTVETLRNIRDMILDTSMGRTVTTYYYGLQ
jgi:hypothetical protein